MERHFMMTAIVNAAKQGKTFECENLSHRDHDDNGEWVEVIGKFKGKIDAYEHITMVHFIGTDGEDDYEVPLYLLTDKSIERLYEQSEVYGEVRCDYLNEEDNWWCIDAWKTAGDNDEGEVVGWVDAVSGNIYYKHETAMCSQKVREVAESRQAEIRAEKYCDLKQKIRDEYNRISENEDYIHIDDMTAFAKDVLVDILNDDEQDDNVCYDFEDEFHNALRELIVSMGVKYAERMKK